MIAILKEKFALSQALLDDMQEKLKEELSNALEEYNKLDKKIRELQKELSIIYELKKLLKGDY